MTVLLLASESLAAWCHKPRPSGLTPKHARSLEDGADVESPCLHSLVRIAEQIERAWPEIGPLAEGMSLLPAEIGVCGPLRSLRRGLFPGSASRRVLTASGKPILSRREVEVLREASQDHSRDEIAQRLGVTLRTVDTHFQNIYKKLGVQIPMQAARRAASLGYLEIIPYGKTAAASRVLRVLSGRSCAECSISRRSLFRWK